MIGHCFMKASINTSFEHKFSYKTAEVCSENFIKFIDFPVNNLGAPSIEPRVYGLSSIECKWFFSISSIEPKTYSSVERFISVNSSIMGLNVVNASLACVHHKIRNK